MLACPVEVKAQSIEGWSAAGTPDGFRGRDGFVRAWEFCKDVTQNNAGKRFTGCMLDLGWHRDTPLPYAEPVLEFADRKAFQVCAGSGMPSVICAMKYAAEDDALTLVQSSLKACSEGTASHQAHHCPAVVAYIKQRWSY